jgi:hypothetical protein
VPRGSPGSTVSERVLKRRFAESSISFVEHSTSLKRKVTVSAGSSAIGEGVCDCFFEGHLRPVRFGGKTHYPEVLGKFGERL